jgi:hypothetical protein
MKDFAFRSEPSHPTSNGEVTVGFEKERCEAKPFVSPNVNYCEISSISNVTNFIMLVDFAGA